MPKVTERTPLKQLAISQTTHADGYGDDKSKQPSGSKDGEAKDFSLRNMPKRSIIILVMCTINAFNDGVTFSLMAPFYPQEAAKKGTSDALVGFIFATFQIFFTFFSPIFGTSMNHFGARFLYIAGIIVGGFGSICFGFLNYSPPGAWFIGMSIAIRILQGIGMAASYTTGFAFLATEFPKDVTTVLGVVVTAEAIGLTLGPVLGGALYEIGGFGLPFFVIGGMVLLNGPIIWAFLPAPSITKKEIEKSVFDLFRSPLIVICIFCCLMQAIGLSFIEPTLANHLEKFKLSTVVIGLIFVIPPAIHGLFAPIWGHLTDRKNVHATLIVLGLASGCVGMLLLGPSPILPFIPFELWPIMISLVLIGWSTGMNLIATMKTFLVGSFEIGFQDNMQTYGMVSGLFSVSFGGGLMLGPIVGGVMVQNIGFDITTTIFAAGYFFFLVLSSSFFLYRRRKRQAAAVSSA